MAQRQEVRTRSLEAGAASLEEAISSDVESLLAMFGVYDGESDQMIMAFTSGGLKQNQPSSDNGNNAPIDEPNGHLCITKPDEPGIAGNNWQVMSAMEGQDRSWMCVDGVIKSYSEAIRPRNASPRSLEHLKSLLDEAFQV